METWESMQHQGNSRSLREWLHDSQFDLQEAHTQYAHGVLDLTQRAWAEELYLNICRRIQQDLDPSNRAHRPIIDELQERMADKFYVNFPYSNRYQTLGELTKCSQYYRLKG